MYLNVSLRLFPHKRFMASVTALITQKERTVNAARKAIMTRPGGLLQLKTPLNAEVSIL